MFAIRNVALIAGGPAQGRRLAAGIMWSLVKVEPAVLVVLVDQFKFHNVLPMQIVPAMEIARTGFVRAVVVVPA